MILMSWYWVRICYTNLIGNKKRKFLMDAAPMVGTAASMAMVRDIIQEGSLSEIEIEMWLSSLAFQTKPTLEMITVVSVIIILVKMFTIVCFNCGLHSTADAYWNKPTPESYALHFGHDQCLLSHSLWMQYRSGNSENRRLLGELYWRCVPFSRQAAATNYRTGFEGTWKCWCDCFISSGSSEMLRGMSLQV